MTGYIIRFIEAKGIIQSQGSIVKDPNNGLEYFRTGLPPSVRGFRDYLLGKDAFLDQDQARTQGRERISQSVKRIKARLQKLRRRLDETIPEAQENL